MSSLSPAVSNEARPRDGRRDSCPVVSRLEAWLLEIEQEAGLERRRADRTAPRSWQVSRLWLHQQIDVDRKGQSHVALSQ